MTQHVGRRWVARGGRGGDRPGQHTSADSAGAVWSTIASTTVTQSARSTPWPAPSTRRSRARGISAASASPCSTGNIGSAVPWITSVGTAIVDKLCDGPARGDADHVGRRQAVPVEHAGDVGHQVGAGVPGSARLVGGRAARVAVVVADHEPAGAGEQSAEPLLPPQHGRAQALDEHDRAIGRVAERFRAQLGAVDVDHAFGHVASHLRSRRVPGLDGRRAGISSPPSPTTRPARRAGAGTGTPPGRR
jgi:hypothetical protein